MLRENPIQGDMLMYLKPLGAPGDLYGGNVSGYLQTGPWAGLWMVWRPRNVALQP